MGLYRLFLAKDTTLYSKFPEANTGADSLLEIGVDSTGEVARALVAVNQSDVNSLVTTLPPSTASYTAHLTLHTATANNISSAITIEALPLAKSWTEGIGHFGDTPETTQGANWQGPGSGDWTATQAFTSSLDAGQGGSWKYSASGVVSSSYAIPSKNFGDVRIDITNFIKAAVANRITNNGLLLKFRNDLDYNEQSNITFYSLDSNTIYHPYIEFRWNTFTNTNTTLATLSTSTCDIIVKDVNSTYVDEGKVRFRVFARPKYPTRVYRTTSIYLTNYVLPDSTYWAIQDDFTKEYVVPFDTTATKLSKDNGGSYFDVYMDMLYPNRHYRLVLQTTIDGSTITIPDLNTFKVVSNG